MKTALLSVAALVIGTSTAFAASADKSGDQSTTAATYTQSIEAASARSVQTYSFNLDQTSDPSLAPLPADAGDYEAASSSEVQQLQGFTFTLD